MSSVEKPKMKQLKACEELVQMFFYIQNKRMDIGREKFGEPVNFTQIAKVVYNAIEKNPNILNSIIEVEIKK